VKQQSNPTCRVVCGKHVFSLLRISAVNNFGPHLCQLVSFVALPLVFADHGKPYFAASSVRAVCEGRRMMLDFSGRLDYVLVAACLRPLVSRSVLRALRRAEADRELDRRTRGDWNEFVDQTNNATANTFVWDKGLRFSFHFVFLLKSRQTGALRLFGKWMLCRCRSNFGALSVAPTSCMLGRRAC
jgi:hypothetical protein